MFEYEIDNKAKEVSAEIRSYVRDRFTPGSLDSLDDLQKHVEQKVKDAIFASRGVFSCVKCSRKMEIEKAICGPCSEPH